MNLFPPPRFRIVLNEPRLIAQFQVEPSEEEWKKILKCKTTHLLPITALHVIEEMKKIALDLIDLKAVYAILTPYNEFKQLFPDAHLAGLCVLTIGPKLELEVDQKMHKNEITAGTILDAIGSMWTEAAADALGKTIAREAEILGLTSLRRRSPGYHPWTLSGQRAIFTHLPVSDIGISLNSAFMMSPRKSVSFGIPIVPRLKSADQCS